MRWWEELKPGDKVYTVERHPSIPGEYHPWISDVVKVESNYVETTYAREPIPWLIEAIKRLAPNHRTFERVWVKNYVSPKGEINLIPFGTLAQ